MVAMRVWVKCMKSKANITVPQTGTAVPPNMFFKRIYRKGSISAPKRVPMKRQPKGVIPKARMPRAMISLPRGGWDIS